MPRQPFLPQHKGKHFCFDERGLATNREAAALIGQIIAEWSRVEHQAAMVLAAMLGENPQAGVALFSTISNSRAQREASNAVARVVISDSEIRLLLQAVIGAVHTIGKSRNDIAHGVMGWSFDLPELTLWVSSSDLSTYEADAWNRMAGKTYDPKTHHHDKLERSIFYYKESDFRDLLKSIAGAKQWLFQLYGLLRHAKGSTSPEYRQLCTVPQIHQALDRLRRDTRNNP